MNAISMQNVSVTIKRKIILPTFWLTLEPNKIYGLIGANGAGKTTILRLIAGFQKPTSGQIFVQDKNPYNNFVVSKDIIFIDDKQEYPPFATVESVCHAYSLFYPKWEQEYAQKLFTYFRFNPYDRYDLLSKGRKSLFNFIVGISANCPITLMDEPTTGMDIKTREDFYKILLNAYIQNSRTIIISNHYMEEMERLLEEVVIITKEKEVVIGSIEDLQNEIFIVTGLEEAIDSFSFEKIYRSRFIAGKKQLVVRYPITEELMDLFKQKSIQYTKLSASQASVYLTHDVQGGIEDVFN